MERFGFLAVLAVALVIAVVVRPAEARRFAWGQLTRVAMAVTAFAFAVRPLGLVIASLAACIALNIPGLRGQIGASVLAVILAVGVTVAWVRFGDLPVALWPSFGGP